MPERATDDPGKVAMDVAIRTGEAATPVAGYLYFPYSGKVSKIKNLRLIYRNAGQDWELKIR